MSNEKNIYQRSDGRWEARAILSVTGDDKKKYKSFYGKTKAEVEAKRELFLKTSEGIRGDKNAKFSDICEAWLYEKSQTIKLSSVAIYRSMISKHIISFFGNMSYLEAAISEKKFEKLLKKQNIPDETIGEHINLLRQILNWYSPKEAKTHKKKSKNVAIFTDEEFVLIKDSLTLYSIDIAFLAYTGVTVSELAGLKWSDCNFEDSSITISSNVLRVANSSTSETSKTRLVETAISPRTIPMSKELKAMLKRIPKKDQKGYIAGNNTCVEPRTIQNRCNSFLSSLNLEGSPSKIRDTFCVRAIRKHALLIDIAYLMGNSEEAILSRYSCWFDELRKTSDTRLRNIVD